MGQIHDLYNTNHYLYISLVYIYTLSVYTIYIPVCFMIIFFERLIYTIVHFLSCDEADIP